MDNFNSTTSQAELTASQLISAITNGEFALAAAVFENGEEIAHEEYVDITAEIENHVDTIVATLGGSMESLNSIWSMLTLYGSKLNDKMTAGLGENEEIPLMAIRIYPEEEVDGGCYIEMAYPQMWSFSALSYGQPADKLRIAFHADLCGVYKDEDDEKPDVDSIVFDDFGDEE